MVGISNNEVVIFPARTHTDKCLAVDFVTSETRNQLEIRIS